MNHVNTEIPADIRGGPTFRDWLLPFTCAFFAVGLVALGFTFHDHAKRAAELTAHETLRATSLLSARLLDTWLSERAADAESLGTSGLLVQALNRWERGGPENAENNRVIQNHLESLRSLYAYQTAAIIDKETKQAVFRSGAPLDMEHLLMLAGVNVVMRPEWIELYNVDEDHPHVGLVRTITAGAQMTRYVIYLELNPLWLLASLTEAAPDARQGETILVRTNGLQYLSSVNGPRLKPLTKTVMDARRQSVSTMESLLTAPDARVVVGRNRDGVEGIASRASIVLPGWMVVSQLPDSSIYGVVEQRSRVFFLGTAAFVLVGFLLYVAWRRSDRHRNGVRESSLRRHYQKMLRSSADQFLLADDEGTILDASQSSVEAYGYPRDKLIGMAIHRLRPPAHAAEQAAIWEAMKPGDSVQVLMPRLRANGSTFLLEGSMGCFEANDRRYFISLGRDITRQAEVDTQLRVATSFFERSAAAIVICDDQRRIVAVNPQFTNITGYHPADVIGQPTALLNAGLDPAALEQARFILREEGFWEGETHLRRKDGVAFPARLLACAHHGTGGKLEQYVDFFTDLTRLKQAESRAAYLAIHDSITDLPNRAKLEQDLPHHISVVDFQATSPHNSLSLALVNLDRFKAVNESFGYAQGNALLVEVATRLGRLCPDLKGLYRYGADEFMLVLEGNPVTHAVLISQVRALLAPSICLGAHRVSPTASIGIASYPGHAQCAEDLLHNVESAMHSAKAQGRNTWRLYAPEMNASAYQDMLLAMDLRQAIDAGELQMHLQPQFTLANGATVGAEALLRWTHKERGPVSPGHFIPIAESSGMIAEISSWVLREAARTWSAWRSQGLDPLPIAVNLSAVQFQAPDFLYEVRRVVSEFNLPAGALEMELTESILMANTDAAVELMHQLVAMGIQIAIDDFGTGYSSLSYLRRFPVSKLKIDRSFILDLGKSGESEAEAIASAVIAMAKSLKLRVIAEGVETIEQSEFLKSHGCDEVQGYLYARPMAVDAVTRTLTRSAPSPEDDVMASEQVAKATFMEMKV